MTDRVPVDRGAVDISIEMLFGMVATLFVLLVVFEAGAYWHAHNVLDDAASDGARIAAAYDGSCAAGIEAARAAVTSQAGSWAGSLEITCTDGPVVTVGVAGDTPGVLGATVGWRARVAVSAPKER
jgi:Flp pilus assembly protein TadG